MPGVRIGPAFLSIERTGWTNDSRQRWRYYLDDRGDEYSGEISSGIGGYGMRPTQQALENLLSFMSAAAEAYRYSMSDRTSDNDDLFEPAVMEFCYQNAEEIDMLAEQLREEQLIEE